MSQRLLGCFAVNFLPKNFRPPLDSKDWTRDAHSNLVFFTFPVYLTCPSFSPHRLTIAAPLAVRRKRNL
jgi:hypothetical protein